MESETQEHATKAANLERECLHQKPKRAKNTHGTARERHPRINKKGSYRNKRARMVNTKVDAAKKCGRAQLSWGKFSF